MGTLHFVGGEKGGVGKSFTARLLAQYMVDTHRPFIGFDTDRSHATFTRFYEQFISPITVDDVESLDQIVDMAEENPGCNIIVDLAAQTARKLQQWMSDCELLVMMEELDYQVYVWHILDDSADAAFLLDKTLDAYANTGAKIVVVENHGRGGSFQNFENSKVYMKAKERKVHLVMLARLNEALTQKIDFNNYSFWAAANSRKCMKLTEAQRVRVWLKHAYNQLDVFLAASKKKETTTV